ncbi:MAG TPA: DUF4157 domain-containing protein [Actinomycetota bacterium]|nr:DUF4157 domain-containing protein [Actinomycetota bacterium]
MLQRNLAIGSHDDVYEQEADSVAERVMRMPEPRMQRKCREREAEDKTSSGTVRRVAASPSPSVRRRATKADAAGGAPPIVNDVVSGAGRSLDPDTRSFMESRFRHDFSDVRIHTGSRAAESARAVNAVAYTVGPNIVFEEGVYRPETDAGRRLIAHELTHVIQQGVGDSSIRPESENEFGDNTILDADRGMHRYRSSNRRVQRQVACYCCISSVAITNVSRIDTATRMGHSFDFEIRTGRTTQHGPRLEPECTLEWWERTNVPYTSGMAANTWTDMFRLVPTSPTFNPWNNRPTACDTASTVTINDPPSLGRRPGRTVTRTLEFNLKVKSGPGGSCTNAEQSATATQVLSMVNGAPDWASSSFS